jgi:NitT/TauT family transport system ATP-binding protein
LAHTSFECRRGEFVAIVGPSGCGKSTVLRLIAQLQLPTSGHLQLGWEDQNNSAGFVFQQPTLLPWRNVIDNIALPLELRGVGREQRHEAAKRARTLVQLSAEDESKLPRMLSGGMKMRVSVARALVSDPIVMLMDEPFGAVDDLLRTRLNEEVVSLWQNHQWTTLFVTHNISEAVLVSQRVLVMSPRPGQIVDSIPVDLPYPRTEEVRGTAEFAKLTYQVSKSLRTSAESIS